MKTTKVLNGRYVVSGEWFHANIVRGPYYGSDQWHCEIRRRSTGEMVREAGLWSRKCDAIEEAMSIIPRLDGLHIPTPEEQFAKENGVL